MMSRNFPIDDSLIILHRVKYQENNSLLDAYSANKGRIRLLVKGAKGAKAQSTVQPFQYLQASWIGNGELKTLIRKELLKTFSLRGASLFCGFYLNELLLRTTPLESASTNLFELYLHSIQGLESTANQPEQELLLRQFEWGLLMELGYAFSLTEDEAGNVIEPNKQYAYVENQGLVSALLANSDLMAVEQFNGDDLLALSQWQLTTPSRMRMAKRLMRIALMGVLGERPLKSRVLYKQLVR